MSEKDKNIEAAKVDKTRQNLRFSLDDIDNRILSLILEFPKITDSQIGKEVSLCRQQVNKRKNKPAFQKRLSERLSECQEQVINILLKAKTKAALKLTKHIDSQDDRVSIRACEDILNKELYPDSITSEDVPQIPEFDNMSDADLKKYIEKETAKDNE